MFINDNIAALDAQNNLSASDSALSQVVNELSSGLQINTAADNPAGYSIAESLQSEINGYDAAQTNSQTAVSVLQTAESAMNQQEQILQQANALAAQAANTTTQAGVAASADNQEFQSLITELDQIASSTSFAGVSLLNGSNSALTFQVGPTAAATDAVVVNLSDTSSVSLGVTSLDISTVAGADAAMTAVQSAISALASAAASVGASQNQIEALASNVTVAAQNLTSAHADLVDVNVATATSQFTADQILEQSGIAVLAQAQQLPALALKLLP